MVEEIYLPTLQLRIEKKDIPKKKECYFLADLGIGGGIHALTDYMPLLNHAGLKKPDIKRPVT